MLVKPPCTVVALGHREDQQFQPVISSILDERLNESPADAAAHLFARDVHADHLGLVVAFGGNGAFQAHDAAELALIKGAPKLLVSCGQPLLRDIQRQLFVFRVTGSEGVCKLSQRTSRSAR